MQTPYTAAQKKGARIRIQKSLTGCYAGEYRMALRIGTEEHKVAVAMCLESGAQIQGGEISADGKYQSFAPLVDAFPHKGFKWINGHKTNPRNY